MQTLRRSLVAAALATLTFAATAAAKPPAGVPAPPLPLATPESQGMSSERLERLHAGIQRFVDEGKHAGAVTARSPATARSWTGGPTEGGTSRPGFRWRRTRSAASTPCPRSSPASPPSSCSKRRAFKLDDPIGDTLPELGRMKVLIGGTAEKPLLADAKTPITIRHLLDPHLGPHLRLRRRDDRQDLPGGEALRRGLPGRVRAEGLAPAARAGAGRALHLRRLDRRRGGPRGEDLGPQPGGVPRGADLAAPRDEGHRLRRPRGEAREARQGV